MWILKGLQRKELIKLGRACGTGKIKATAVSKVAP